MQNKHVYEISLFEDRLSEINKTFKLVSVLLELKDERNRISMERLKFKLASAVKRNPRTVAEWLRILCRNGVIKYKYAGEIMINPYFVYDGATANYEKIQTEWGEFRSDIPALKREYVLPA